MDNKKFVKNKNIDKQYFIPNKKYFTREKSKRIISLLFIVSIIELTSFSKTLWANPVIDPTKTLLGATVSSPNSNTLQINQTADKAIINWQTFNIAPNETTRFVQPSASAIALNRVDANFGPSKIEGILNANGRIILINAAGVVFTKTATVDVAGLIVSTANLRNKDFLDDNYHFVQNLKYDNRSIINEGNIKVTDTGLVALVAPGVINNGVIKANLGKVILASGTEFTIVDPYGDHLIEFAANKPITKTPTDQNGNPIKNAVSNSGTIIANGGTVLMSAHATAGVVDNVINMDGIIQAKTVKQQNGTIILAGGDEGIINISGKINASGKKPHQTGGNVKINGQYIAIFSTAVIDVSGGAGGGTVLIGNSSHNTANNTILPLTQAIYVAPNATINANAITAGNGGHVIILAEDVTKFYGNISVQGGLLSGNGGFVETSGNYLDVNNTKINLSAQHGATGEWLLDPFDLIITNGGQNFAGGNFSNTNPDIFSGSTGPAIITWNTILNDLITANIILTTTGAAGLSGNITVQNSMSYNSNNNLTFLAANNFTVNSGANIINSGAGAISVYAGWNGNSTNNPSVTPGIGTINLNANVQANNLTLVAGTNISSTNNPPTTTSTNIKNITATSTDDPLESNFNSNLVSSFLPRTVFPFSSYAPADEDNPTTLDNADSTSTTKKNNPSCGNGIALPASCTNIEIEVKSPIKS